MAGATPKEMMSAMNPAAPQEEVLSPPRHTAIQNVKNQRGQAPPCMRSNVAHVIRLQV
jgi:hypothetical protein